MWFWCCLNQHQLSLVLERGYLGRLFLKVVEPHLGAALRQGCMDPFWDLMEFLVLGYMSYVI
jgi:hypothetical protein